ncbi:phage tail protein [Acinetobacter sp. TGL-Y2]|uniref:phage tail-collar fiber domain-containing protein n=1 Tax=Acinetobacter sp. TGL-Y2 TaxID=1407071 RepID=UPI0019056D0E|nr:phage tail protein [Acinetobacter sp. TGL-Y2]MBJ9373711.1 phage tail protein [Acinetobacter sp. TGL-Y2]
MANTYKGILTNNGKALIANATVNNKINYSHIAVGDGNGSVPTPSETRPALINEKARIALNVVEINPNNTNQIVCEAIIPTNTGGFYIRELGLYAGNTMIVNASYPPTYKPLADEGGAREIAIKIVINIQNAEVIALYLDDSLIYATREWVNTNYIRRNEIVDNLTTDASNKPLSAKQGKKLQDDKFDKSGGILTGEININTGESSPIKTVINKSSAITTNSPTELASIIHALSFGWYQSEWQIGNIRSGSQETAGFGVTLGNSNLRFLINGNGVSNYGTFYSLGKVTAPEFTGLLDGSIKAKDQRNVSPSQVGLDRFGCYFADYAGIRYGSSNGAVYGDFLAFNTYHDQSGGKANGLFLDKTSQRIYHFQNNFGADSWGTPREIAYTDNQNFTGINTFEHGIRVSSFGIGFKYLAKGIAGDNDAGWIGIGADQLNSGYLELGTGDDGAEPIYVRQYQSNSLSDEGARSNLKNEFVLLDSNGDTRSSKNIYASSFRSTQDEATMHSTSGRYLFINSNRWGSFSPASGYIPLSIDCGGTGNGQGIAPSASKLQVARKINNVDFDGTKDITIQDATAFYANGITAASNEYPAWNSKSGVYQKNENGFSANVLHFLGSGSATAIQLLAYYGNGGLYYRSSRDSVGFEKNFDRIVTETGGIAPLATKLLNARKIFGQNFDGTNDVSGNLTADTGMLLADSYHYIDMGRSGLDRMNFNVYGGVFNFINAQDGSIVARLNSNGIDCNAATASRLKTPRKINDINFDGTSDINISAPMRYLGNVNPSTINDAISDGFYLAADVNISGLYPYGILEVRVAGNTIHQTYYSHNDSLNGSVAVRQSWGGNGAFTPWRVLDNHVAEVSPIPFSGDAIPAGYIAMMGQAISQSSYPILYSVYGVYLPDMRGEFIRGWDAGRGVDSGRGLRTWQGDAMRNITGTVGGGANDYSSGVFYESYKSNDGQEGSRFRQTVYGLDASRQVPVANEIRPRNIAFNYIVRAI